MSEGALVTLCSPQARETGVRKERASSRRSRSYSQRGRSTMAWAQCSPSPPSLLLERSLSTAREALGGRASPSTHPPQGRGLSHSWSHRARLRHALSGGATTKMTADPLALPRKQEFLVRGSIRTPKAICCWKKSFLLI